MNALILAVMLMGVAHSSWVMAGTPLPESVPGELIVKYREGSRRPLSTMRLLYRAAQVNQVRRFGPLMRGFEHLIVSPQASVEDAIRTLESDPRVEYAVRNLRIGVPGFAPSIPRPLPTSGPQESPPPARRPTVNARPQEPAIPSPDPLLAQSYGFAKVGAPEAWNTHFDARRVIVAIVDSGVDYNHEDLALNLWRNPNPIREPEASRQDLIGYNFFHNDGLPYDDVISASGRGHGTHVAGIIGAVGSNGVGISGVAPRASLMILKVLHSEAGGSLADAIRAIDYAIAHGARILNHSWSLNAEPAEESKSLLPIREAIQRAGRSGALSIFAAGNGDDRGQAMNNDGALRAYPAAFIEPSLISVAASDEQDRMADFSNFGKSSVHLAAPGVNILSLVPSNLRFGSRTGTSMAAPFVSGAAALVWSKNPGWSFDQVKAALLGSVDGVPDTKISQQTVTGGRLNVRRALEVQ